MNREMTYFQKSFWILERIFGIIKFNKYFLIKDLWWWEAIEH
jgi:hypothetical protein